MRRKNKLVSLALATLIASGGIATAATTPPKIRTPLGQVKIMTVNARQNGVLGLKRFEDMYELSHAVRNRPPAWNGGSRGAVAAPDVIALQEVRSSNVEIIVRLFRQRFKIKYQVLGFEDAASQIVYNPETVTPAGEVTTWEDVCSDRSPGRRDDRFYQLTRFTENRSGLPFAVIPIHIPKNFFGTDQADCYFGNLDEVRTRAQAEPSTVFIAGDFNRRAVEQQHECDPNEISPIFEWYRRMTAPEDGMRAYGDAVRDYHRARGISLASQWTHEQKTESPACDGSSRIRRSRIDYIFYSGATVAEASADHPGWSGGPPGSRHPTNHKYSDHRFVWGRFIFDAAPLRVGLPQVVHGTRGNISVSWTPVEGASGYRVFRAAPGKQYSLLQETGAETLSFVDFATEHGVTYKYVVAAVGTGEIQGQESRPGRETADKRGPQVVSVHPSPGAMGVDRRVTIRIVFSERVGAESVTNDRIRLFRDGKRIAGTVRQVKPRVLIFDPTYPLWKATWHKVVTKPVQDKYRNVGGTVTFSFKTAGKRRR